MCSRKSRYGFFVTMSAVPYLPPRRRGSSVIDDGAFVHRISTIFHLIGSEDLKPGPSQ